ncbi:DUF308 domain-containing protein (plasmid) [Mycobacterium marinum]|uniref:hypothetical protein n=1 Tax=Mycobacterium marinum TaxID=1781 RepID=UPI00045FDCFB|nr:hypothetical protein [Mycobacterium marinum]AXN50449.1 hypothetical protein CCUG20998_03045 [Mycobacterium marinum]RFZ39208.1 hypothetical protein NCTC2275_00478 [Mycobacterium marinum]WCS21228.1 DUF308 domain-containing protein [Mycobacterium marinum]WOR07587.1 DUF308 domain-containing protein [Mycobacterium marinum]CDM79532.1 hypothetical protein MMARE11_p00290 [Mycobacterium marinum E11]
MPIIALVMAIIALAALMTAVVTDTELIAWVCIGAGVIGLVLLAADMLRARQQRDTQPAATEDGVLAFDADYPDDRPAADAPIHSSDKEVQREIMREERVLHPDTGPRDPDITREEMREAIRHRRRH